MSQDFIATIREPDRAARVQSALGEGVPIYLTTVRPTWVAMGGEEELLYFLDLEQYTEAQREALYLSLCQYQGLDPTDAEIRASYEELGIPLHANGVTVTVHNPHIYAGHPDPHINPYSFWALLGQGGDDVDEDISGIDDDEW